MVECLGFANGDNWAVYHGDCVEVLTQLPGNCIDVSIFSPPFSGLYIYSDSECDMGNCASDEEFIEQYDFFAKQLFRVTRPGRLAFVHCKDLVYYRNARGTAGLRDFPGDLIRSHIRAGFDYHSRFMVRRCPVREMTKTKAHGLLYKQLRADSTFSRQGLPEYVLVFRKWARTEAEESLVRPVTHTHASFPLPQWQTWADCLWSSDDIGGGFWEDDDCRVTDVLDSQKSPDDEKHICPLPLSLIRRCVILGSNPGETVLDPFGGIGSTGHVALQEGRKYVGIELKESYFRQQCKNLAAVTDQGALAL